MTRLRFVAPALATLCLLGARPAAGQAFAEPEPFADPAEGGPTIAADPRDRPPEPRYYDDDRYDRYLPRSTVRIHTGPALRISESSPDGGLFAAIDVGERAAGVRASGSWVRVGAEGGMSQYAGELWIDFGHDRRLHPILGAGAGVARLDLRDPTSGGLTAETIGIGVLRGTLAYMLPVGSTDARASIDVIGAVPAIRSEAAEDVAPWALVLATVGVGF